MDAVSVYVWIIIIPVLPQVTVGHYERKLSPLGTPPLLRLIIKDK